MDRTDPPKFRRDGWTPGRQLRFLDALARTRSVTRAAAFAGMSRESAYRLRGRRDGALFAAAWDRAMKSHNRVNFASRRRVSDAPISRRNPSKVRKWKKCTIPDFGVLLNQLRDLGDVIPPAAATAQRQGR